MHSSLVFGTGESRPKIVKKERIGPKWWAEKYMDNGAYCLKHKVNRGEPMPDYFFHNAKRIRFFDEK